MLFCLLSAVLLLPILVSAGTFEKPVIALGPKEFNKVMKEDRMSMVVFYAPWCGHCKSLAPEYAQAASSLSPIIPFYSVDCDEDSNKPLCAKYDVKGFPTIKGFTRGAKIPPKDYTGERKRGGLVGWASGMVGDKVKKMKVPSKGGVGREEGLEEVRGWLKSDPTKPHVLLIHPNSATIPLMWKALSQQISSYSFGYIRDADANVKEGLSLPPAAATGSNGPRVVFWKEGKGEDLGALEIYEGPLKFDSLLAFLSGSSPNSSSSSNPSSSSQSNPSSPPPTSSGPPVPNASQLQRAADRAKAEARWAEEERRDTERIARMEEKKRLRKLAEEQEQEEEVEVEGGSETEEAGAVPAEETPVVVEPEVEAEGKVEDPVPAGAATTTEVVDEEARETGRESLLTEEQEKVVEVEEESVGGQEEEVVPELKIESEERVVEVEEVIEERKRDEL